MIFDTDTDRYLEKLGGSASSGTWSDVVALARRRGRLVRASMAGGAVAATLGILAGAGAIGGASGPSIVERAEASVLRPLAAGAGAVVHTLVEYRTEAGRPFIEYETWIAPDGAWCRRTAEGVPGRPFDTRLTQCRSADGVIELHLPASGEVLRSRPGAGGDGTARVPVPVREGTAAMTVRASKDGTIIVERDGKRLTADEIDALSDQEQRAIKLALVKHGQAADPPAADPGPSPDWLTEDVVDAFRSQGVREAGTATFEGREYAKLVTADGGDTILVDPETGEGRVWIPSVDAFGVPTTVVRTRDVLPLNDATRRSLSLTAAHPEAAVRDVSAAQLERALSAQYPRG